jgi:hypothetical protein
MAKELPIPDEARKDNNARELVRIWAASNEQHVSLATGLWDDPAAWGIMLVDLARHAAATYIADSEEGRAAILRRMREGFDAEWDHITR